MNCTSRLLALTLSAALAGSVGCQPSQSTDAGPSPPDVTQEPSNAALESPKDQTDEALTEPVEPGLAEDPAPPASTGEAPAPVVDLPESLPTIDQLPALSSESPVNEGTKLRFTPVGRFKVRDGVYVFRLDAVGGGTREIMMTVETQANGFAVRRGDQTRLRFVTDEAGVAFASEPGSGDIAGRGVASGDDWIRGAYRTRNEDGTSTGGAFDLRKLFDPKTPRTPSNPPAPAADPAVPGVSGAVRED